MLFTKIIIRLSYANYVCVQSYVDIGHPYNGSNKFTIKSHAQIVRIWQMSVIKEFFLSIS